MEHVRLKHPEIEGRPLVPKTSTGNWVGAGWEVAEEGIFPDEPTPVDPAPTGSIRITHPELKREETVPAASLSTWETAGWKLVQEDVQPTSFPPAPENPEAPIAVETETEETPAPSGRRQAKEK